MILLAAIALIVGAGIVGLVLGLCMSIWAAYWLYPAWGWFVVPLGVPQISLWHFMALLTLFQFRFPKLQNPEMKKNETGDYIGYGLGIVLGPMLVWLILRWLHGLS